MKKISTFIIKNKKLIIDIITMIILDFVLFLLTYIPNFPIGLLCIGVIGIAFIDGAIPASIIAFFTSLLVSCFVPTESYFIVTNVLFAFMMSLMPRFKSFHKVKFKFLISFIIVFIDSFMMSLLSIMLDIGGLISMEDNIFYVMLSPSNLGNCLTILMAVFIKNFLTKYTSLLVIFLIGIIYNNVKSKNLVVKKEYKKIDIKHLSIRFKMVSLITISSFILVISSLTVGSIIYKNIITEKYIDHGKNVTETMKISIDGDRINDYLADGNVLAEDYVETKSALEKICHANPDVLFLYVYQIQEDGCHVVFDVDTEDVEAGKLGEIIGFEDAFSEDISSLLHGESIAPKISNDSYGWLLTIYTPILDSNGKTVAYACVDIPASDIQKDIYAFIMKSGSILVIISIIMLGIALFYSQKKLTNPIEVMIQLIRNYDMCANKENLMDNEAWLHREQVHTNDELQELYQSICSSEMQISQSIKQIKKSNEQLKIIQRNTIYTMASMVESRDENTGGHIKRTSKMVDIITNELLKENVYANELTPEMVKLIIDSAPLHDIGKISIPDTILNKPGKLTEEEFSIMKTHTTIGKEIIVQALDGVEDNLYLNVAMLLAAYHHEWWNGNGYMEGLKGEQIPLCARIMAVADVFDALVSKRKYKDAFDFDRSVEIIKSESGTHFDPKVVNAFLNCLGKIKDLLSKEDINS